DPASVVALRITTSTLVSKASSFVAGRVGKGLVHCAAAGFVSNEPASIAMGMKVVRHISGFLYSSDSVAWVEPKPFLIGPLLINILTPARKLYSGKMLDRRNFVSFFADLWQGKACTWRTSGFATSAIIRGWTSISRQAFSCSSATT